MTREEEIRKAAIARYEGERQYEITKMQAFCVGARWADSNPVYFKGQTDKIQEHEAAFAKDWLKEHRGEKPTYADAIAWAEKKIIEKACEYLKGLTYQEFAGAPVENVFDNYEIGVFKKAMEE